MNNTKEKSDIFKMFDSNYYLFFWGDYIAEERTKAEVKFIKKALRLKKNFKILDVCCGHGRHAIELSKLGFDVTGIDVNKKFLRIARKCASKNSLTAKFLQGDVRSLDSGEQFDVAYCFFTSFGFFDDDENEKIISNVSRALKRNGKFLIDVVNKDYIIHNFRKHIIFEKGNDFMLHINEYDPVKSRIYNRIVFIKNGKAERMEIFVRIYSCIELSSLLEKHRLKVIKTYGGINKNLEMDSNRMIIVAQKV